MELKIKLVSNVGRTPTYGSEGAAGFDLYATSSGIVMPGKAMTFGSGIAVEMEPGHVLKVYSRSGHGFKHGVRLCNSTAIVDCDYRNEVFIRLHNDSTEPFAVHMGDRIAQGILERVQKVRFVLVDELGATARGMGGLGSTGA